MHVFPVETPRLLMRPIAAGDAALFEHLFTDAETMHFIGAPLTPQRAANSFRRALAGMQRQPIERLYFTMVAKASGDAVGICSLHSSDTAHRSVEAGMMFVAAARGRGYSKEGLVGLIQAVFAHLPAEELWLQFTAGHLAVQRLVLSVGFARRGKPARQDSITEDEPANGQGNAWSVHRERWSPPSTIGNRQ